MAFEQKETSNKIYLGIVGSRHYNDEKDFSSYVNHWIEKNGKPEMIISGGAKGTDTLAKNYALKNNITIKEYYADWNTYGKKAGPMRNTQIAMSCTHLLAFPSRTGKGTQDTIRKVKDLNKDIELHWID